MAIAPQLGPLDEAHGTLVHPKGPLTIDLTAKDRSLTGTVELPEGLTGTLTHAGQDVPLTAGKQCFSLEDA